MSVEVLRYVPVWGAVDEQLKQRIISYWAENKISFSGQTPEQRANSVAFIAEDLQGDVVGLSSVVACNVPRLRSPFFYYRASFAPSTALTNALAEITKQTFEYFNERYDPSVKSSPIGLYATFENPYLNLTRDAIIEHNGLTFIGFNQHGHQERVRYFDGAKISLKTKD